MYSSEVILEKVNKYVAQMTFDREPSSLYDPIRYVLSLGGKRVRPVLMLMAYNLFRDDVDSIFSPAMALETFHNVTLLLDDLMDDSDLRRGFPTVHKKWNANTAILSSDAMLVYSFKMMADNQKNAADVMATFVEATLEVNEGQQYDMSFETRDDVTEDEYIEMIRLKTSALLACALKMGGQLANAPKSDIMNLYCFGEKTGLAFQLMDDYLDVYGDPRIFRKKLGGDIVSNKKTFMLINALNHANAKQRAELDHWISVKEFDRDEKIAAVTRIYDEIGIREISEEKVNKYYAESQKHLDAIAVDDEKKIELRAYAERLINRQF